MCGICGCSNGDVTLTGFDGEQEDHRHEHAHDHRHGHGHDHHHDHGHHHGHDHDHRHDHHGHGHEHLARPADTVALETAILGKNDKLAAENRGWFKARNVLALNFVSSPGSGKTTLLERTILALKDLVPIAVIEGDQETVNDAERIRATGASCVQVNTGTGCHLEADMVQRAVERLRPAENSLVLIENVGNLVCPALFDLGERSKITVLSVTEGADKPAKYPHMIAASEVLVVNKTDLLPYVDFDMSAAIAAARRINPDIRVFRLSATSGDGMGDWCDWLLAQLGRADASSVTAAE